MPEPLLLADLELPINEISTVVSFYVTGVSVDEGMEDLKMASNVSRMRKRFHDLLDDTFSLFGSRREISTTSDGRLGSVEVKGYAPSNK